jgi:cytochrome c peroxidase
MRILLAFFFTLLLSTSAIASDVQTREQSDRQAPDKSQIVLRQARAIFGLLPQRMPGSDRDTPAQIMLGKMLYYEPDLSINRTQSCNSCHPLDGRLAGADNLVHSAGALGTIGIRNAPTTLNAGFQISQFWDGRADDLAEQSKGPILNVLEMGMPHIDFCLKRMKQSERIRQAFHAAFPDQAEPVTYDNLALSIAAFERTLVSRGRFDRFLEGDAAALSEREKEGLGIFINKGCIRCHNGPLLGGMLYQRVGIYHEYKNTSDTGRLRVTGNESDRFVFKVPSLRNVTLTAPYFHDGGVPTLAEAVDEMAWLELDEKLSSTEINLILRFLTSLADLDRTTVPMTPSKKVANWNPPKMETIPEGAQGDLIRYGHELMHRTQALLGRGAKSSGVVYVNSALACVNCHQEDGTKMFGIPWMGVAHRYPHFSSRTNSDVTLEDRINGCMKRSMNGRALPKDSREMQAIVAYFSWLSKDLPDELVGLLKVKIVVPDRRANLDKGARIYREFCQSCHGEDGSGYQARSAVAEGIFVTPPVAGPRSFNTGAGMHRLLLAAPFVKGNMPLGTPWDRPALTDDDAYDVAAYINSLDRPVMAGLDKDWPDLSKKPVDCPYPPYVDGFSLDQHRYGPFKQIREQRKKQPK